MAAQQETLEGLGGPVRMAPAQRLQHKLTVAAGRINKLQNILTLTLKKTHHQLPLGEELRPGGPPGTVSKKRESVLGRQEPRAGRTPTRPAVCPVHYQCLTALQTAPGPGGSRPAGLSSTDPPRHTRGSWGPSHPCSTGQPLRAANGRATKGPTPVGTGGAGWAMPRAGAPPCLTSPPLLCPMPGQQLPLLLRPAGRVGPSVETPPRGRAG
ncbi:hypothetical protein KIL84_005688 [Mauremys mutica]|uniref:Uncharacterized protein n=1 Tax=Mauremys mutica TaxID=74926 RepID=A0A9D4B304_9SAUR|nr:hypothetical protein KIL84_005688 [Mauremys mutica]